MDDNFAKHVYTYTYSDKTFFPYSIRIDLHGNENFCLEFSKWIEKNIKGIWTDDNSNKGYFVKFELEEDAVAFKLRWT